MYGFFQNIDPPPHRPASVYLPPAFGAGGRTHSLGGKGVGGQYFGRRQTLLPEPIHMILSLSVSIIRTHPHDPLFVCFNQPYASIWSFFVCVNQPNPSIWSSLCLFQSAEPNHMILLCLCQSAESIHMIISWSAPISRTHPHDPLCVCFNQPNRREIIL